MVNAASDVREYLAFVYAVVDILARERIFLAEAAVASAFYVVKRFVH